MASNQLFQKKFGVDKDYTVQILCGTINASLPTMAMQPEAHEANDTQLGRYIKRMKIERQIENLDHDGFVPLTIEAYKHLLTILCEDWRAISFVKSKLLLPINEVTDTLEAMMI